jgi:hypothetical protein
MVVMGLHKSLTKSPITASVADLLIAVFASLIQARNSEIVAATAAYAAVIGVFMESAILTLFSILSMS